jgi:hypothetical protein
MLFTYLHFKRVIDAANLMTHLYNTVRRWHSAHTRCAMPPGQLPRC